MRESDGTGVPFRGEVRYLHSSLATLSRGLDLRLEVDGWRKNGRRRRLGGGKMFKSCPFLLHFLMVVFRVLKWMDRERRGEEGG